jgi:hypothetical protein
MLLAKLAYKKQTLTRMFSYLDYDQTNVPVIYNRGKFKESLKFQNTVSLNVTDAER